MPPGTSTSISTSTTTTTSTNKYQQHSFDPRTNNGKSTSTLSLGPSNNGQDDSKYDNSDCSELEEGEIIERDVPPIPISPLPQPPVSKPLPVHPPFSRRYRKPPPSTRQPIGSLPLREQSSGPPPSSPIFPRRPYR